MQKKCIQCTEGALIQGEVASGEGNKQIICDEKTGCMIPY
jgi:hypothetical protein